MAIKNNITIDVGATVSHYKGSRTIGEKGSVLLQDFFLHEKPTRFNWESIPKHIVHAKGAGAYAKFAVTHDLSRYTKDKLLPEIGKETKTFVRFPTVRGENRKTQSGIIGSKRDDIIKRQVGHRFRVNPKPEAATAEGLHVNIGVRTTSTL